MDGLPPGLVDRLLISELLDTYAVALDTRDWDLLGTVFAPDAVIDYTSAGGARGPVGEIVQWLRGALEPFPVSQHYVTNKRIVVEGDSATSLCYLYNPLRSADGTLLFVGGIYRDRLRRTPDGWRIAERVLEATWFQGALPQGAQPPS